MTRSASRLIGASTLALTLLGPLAGCRSAFRYPVQPQDATISADTSIERGMNASLLTHAVTERLVIEVDWVEGGRPHDEALEGLSRTLTRYLPEGKALEIAIDDEIPLHEWEAAEGSFLERRHVLTPYLDRHPAPAGTDLVWLVAVPGDERFLGWYTTLTVAADPSSGGEPFPVDTVFLFHDSIARESALWITPRKVEKAILIHELGHVLGLVSGPDHVEKDNPGHCTEPGCVMAHHRGRSLLYNAPAAMIGKIPDDYCDRCRRDIDRAKQLWREAAAADPEFADTIAARREVRVLRAQACWYARRGDWLTAAERWRRAEALGPTDDSDGDGEAPGSRRLARLCADQPETD